MIIGWNKMLDNWMEQNAHEIIGMMVDMIETT
jgi:hypothetical protein